MNPTLVVCAHGTDDPDGRATTLAVADAASAALPGVDVRAAYADVQRPSVAEAVDTVVADGGRVVVVPLLLSPGYHLEVDVAAAVARHPGRAVATGPLGPHPWLADALLDRVAEAGAGEQLPVVIGVAGSSRPAARTAALALRHAVRERRGGRVDVGFLAAANPSLAAAVAAARAATGSPVAVASYLVGRGFFQRRLEGCGAEVIAAPLGAHPQLVDVVVERYRRASAVA